MTLTDTAPPPAPKKKKAAHTVSFRPDVETEKALNAYCKKHGVKPGPVAEHFMRLGLGLVK